MRHCRRRQRSLDSDAPASLSENYMTKYNDLLTKLIYIDADFISSKYEEIRKVSPETQFAKLSQRRGSPHHRVANLWKKFFRF